MIRNAHSSRAQSLKRRNDDNTASDTKPIKRARADIIPVYDLQEVMTLLREEIKEEPVLELVKGERWRTA
jgi:hypothetical protein